MNIPTQHIYRYLLHIEQPLGALIGLAIALIWVWAAWRIHQHADNNAFIHHIEEGVDSEQSDKQA